MIQRDMKKLELIAMTKWLLGIFFVICIISQHAWAAQIEVYCEGTYTETDFVVQVYANTHNYKLVSAGFKLHYDPNKLAVKMVQRDEDLWSISDGNGIHPYRGPVMSEPGEILMTLGRLDLSDPTKSVTGDRILLAEVTFERKENSIPPSFTVSLGLAMSGKYSNFVAIGGDVLDSTVSFENMEIGKNGNTLERGDANVDGKIDMDDADAIQGYQMEKLDAHEWMDCNDDGAINVQDIACIYYKIDPAQN